MASTGSVDKLVLIKTYVGAVQSYTPLIKWHL